MNGKELEAEFNRLLSPSVPGARGATDRLERGIGLLGISIVHLDSTSSKLAWINISLTVVIFVAAVVQIILTVRGH
jgi:hypothetical protein